MKAFLFTLSITLLTAIGVAEEPVVQKVAEVEIFVSVDCPIANSYVPLLDRLEKQYQAKGIQFLLVYPESGLTDSDLQKHRSEFDISIKGTLDPNHEHVKRAGATVTPEVVVYDNHGKLAYRGMIDNLYTDFGDRRKVATIHYLRDVLDALVEGTEIPHSSTTPVGCFIEELDAD